MDGHHRRCIPNDAGVTANGATDQDMVDACVKFAVVVHVKITQTVPVIFERKENRPASWLPSAFGLMEFIAQRIFKFELGDLVVSLAV